MHDEKFSLWIMLENGLDMFINLLAFVTAYIIAVGFGGPHVRLDSLVVALSVFVAVVSSSPFYHFFNVYRPIGFGKEHFVLSSTVLANLVFFAVITFISAIIIRSGEIQMFMLVWVALTAVISTSALILKKRTILAVARLLRKHRYIVKKVIVVGDNVESSRFFIRQVENDIGGGFMLLGGVGRKLGGDSGIEKLGDFEDLGDVLDKYRPDYAVFAVDSYDKKRLIKLVNECDDRCVKVYFLPVIYGFFKSARQVERLGDVPIINVHSTPLDRAHNAFIKRVMDILGSLVLIILTSPIMLAAAIGVAISSPGPILFKQKRVGMMGKPFEMYKFRSMHVNDGSTTEWTTDEDPRKTRFGNFMRKTSIDELPQLFNVLRGDMSLVGPRPEIPHFVEYFKHRIPLYMVKHYVKPGMTGLAQVKGLRGDTSVEDRIHEDISYIENWSIFLDVTILLQTPFKMINKHEKYAKNEEKMRNSNPDANSQISENLDTDASESNDSITYAPIIKTETATDAGTPFEDADVCSEEGSESEELSQESEQKPQLPEKKIHTPGPCEPIPQCDEKDEKA